MEKRLREAAIEGSVTSLLELLQEDALVLDRVIVACVSDTPLHIAAMLGHIDFVREILSRKPELARELDSRRSSPLHLAAAKGYVDIVKELLHINPDICLVRDRDGRNPLHLAAIKGHVGVLEELVRTRPEATRIVVDRGETILHLCVKYDRLETLKLLVKAISDDQFANRKDEDGNTVLHLAVAEKQIEAIKFLLSSTAIKVNTLNVSGFTALDVLARSPRNLNDMAISDYLRDFGTLRARDIPLGARETGVVRARDLSLVVHDDQDPPPSQGSSWEKNLKKHDNWLKKKKSTLMVVASLIATMAFQAGVNPPGGVWQDNLINAPSDTAAPLPQHLAGWSIMAEIYPEAYPRFLGVNTTAFVTSLSIILLLISGLPFKHRIFMWVLMVMMWVAITSTAITYLFALMVLTPDHENMLFSTVIGVSILAWLGLMALLLLGHTIRLLVRLLKKVGRLCRRSEKQ